MEQLQFDTGVKTYRIADGGELRFNPSDPNLYARFLEAADKIKDLEQAFAQQARALPEGDSGAAVVQLMVRADQQVKQLLGEVFGGENDFHKALGGVNLLAVTENGQQVITNLLQALEPILVAGARQFAREKTDQAVGKAQVRRVSQC